MKSLANYIILETISEKDQASVYIARHKKLERKTLLKVYSGGDKQLIERFEREAKIVADLNSPSIVAIYDFGEADGKFFISMEYVEGVNLQDYLKQHTLSWNEIISFAYQIASSVAVLHKKGYIHRDLKPENILVGTDGRIKLTDFGITLHESLNRVTSDGALLGTPLYMSPEQINNQDLSPASDVFSLGIIFYLLATGVHPFEAEQYAQVFAKILSYEPPPVNTFNKELPSWFADLVANLLHKDYHKRIHDALQIVQIIEKNAERKATQQIPKIIESTHEEISPKPKWIWSLAAILIIFVIYLIFFGREFPSLLQTQLDSTAADSLQRKDSTAMAKNLAANDISNPPLVNETEVKNNQGLHERIPLKPDLDKNLPTTLLIKSYPWCRVYLDYALIDSTPMTKAYTLQPGRYLLGLQNPAYPSFSDSIIVLAHQQNIYSINLDSSFVRLDLKVSPWGEVYIDGKHFGTWPQDKSIYLTKDKHLLEIKNAYYRTWVDTLFCEKQKEITKHIILQELN